MKRLWVLFVVFVFGFCAFGAALGLEYGYSFQDNANLVSFRSDFLYGSGSFKYGGLVSLGYGVQYYSQGGSSALIYGPSFSVGPEVRVLFDSFEVCADLRVSAAYALYPVILRGEADLDLLFNLGSSWKVGVGYGYLFDLDKSTYYGSYSGLSSSVHALVGVVL